jgi:hypothetical protein
MKNKTAIKVKNPVKNPVKKAAAKKKTIKKSKPVKKQSAFDKFNSWLYSKLSMLYWK